MISFDKNRGFIKKILLVVVAIVVLGFLVDFKSLTETDRLRKNFGYLKTLSIPIWIKNYISTSVHYVWDKTIAKWSSSDEKRVNNSVDIKVNQ